MNHRLSAFIVAALLLGACSSEGSDDAAPPTTVEPSSTSSPSTTEASTTKTGPGVPVDTADCPGADEVAAVVGSEVDRTPAGGVSSNTDGLSYSTQGCSYDLADDAGSVSVARIIPEDDAGSDDEPFYLRLEANAKTEAITDGFEPVADLGDDAYRNGTDIVVKYGERMMFVGFANFDEVDDTELNDQIEVATIVADALVPLDLDQDEATRCTDIEEVVNDKVGTVSSTGTSGGGVSVDDVSISAAGCALELQDGRKLSVSVAASDQWDAWVEAKQSSTFTDNFVYASLGELGAYDTGDTLIVNDGEQPLEVGTADLDLDADAAADLRVELAMLALGR